MATPAEEARKYAAEHVFTITSEGRRYRIVGHGLNTTVGGYPAALNAMRSACSQPNIGEVVMLNPPVECAPCDISSIVDRVYPVRVVAEEPVTLPSSCKFDVSVGVDGSGEVHYSVVVPRQKTTAEVVDDMIVGCESMGTTKDQALGFVGMLLKDTPAFEHVAARAANEFSPEAIESIRARDMVPHWRIVVDSIVNKGERLTLRQRYASRSDALKQVRRMLCDRASGMRARHVTIEYRT